MNGVSNALGNSGEWVLQIESQSSTSTDSEETAKAPLQEPSLRDRMLPQESFVDDDEFNRLVSKLNVGLPEKKIPLPSHENTLKEFLELLKKKKLRNFVDVTKELSVKGRNILHYIAAEPDFSIYKPVVKQIATKRNGAACIRLITQVSELESQAVLHVLSYFRNTKMLQFLMNSNVPNIRDHLQESGIIKSMSICVMPF